MTRDYSHGLQWERLGRRLHPSKRGI